MNTYRVCWNQYITPDERWEAGEERALDVLDAQALNFAYPGLLQPTRQEEPEPALPELGTPEYTAMQRRAHRLVQPVRPTTTLDHQAINDRVMVPHDGGGPFDSAH